MIRIFFCIALCMGLCVFARTANAQYEEPCEIALSTESTVAQRIDIKKPGRYCLGQNIYVGDGLIQALAIGLSSGSLSYGRVDIAASGVDFNLDAHEIALHRGAINSAGVVIKLNPDDPPRGASAYESRGSFSNVRRDVRVRNGSIIMSLESRGYGVLALTKRPSQGIRRWEVASIQSDTLRNVSQPDFMEGKELLSTYLASLPERPSLYPETRIVLENLTIRSPDVGIILQGGANVIRNCTIEVDGGTAIWLFGPNALIEDSTIIVNGKYLPLEADAPIRLHHGDGAIIRNNRFIFRDKATQRAVSLAYTGSEKPVTFEGNKIYGLPPDTLLVKDWTGSRQVKESENKIEPAWKAWFNSWR